MLQREARSVRTHDLLEVDAKRLMSAHSVAPEWVAKELRKSPFVVVRRGLVTEQRIPIGVRGCERNQRWGSYCHPELVKSITTPPQLLSRTVLASRAVAIPALRSLQLLKPLWIDLDHLWGPAGSVGFELATGRHVAKPESDLDIMIYAETNMTREDAKFLCARATEVPAVVDIRVETPVCGFCLTEYARAGSASILLRTPDRLVLGDDPWNDELTTETRDKQQEKG
jgi:phosphoribosyl-dephospho-CoA transferase